MQLFNRIARHFIVPKRTIIYESPTGEKLSRFDATIQFDETASNPYATSIKRKRVVSDPSIPTEKIECLKWSNWWMLRDVKRRYMSARYYQYRHNLMSLANCRTLPSIVRSVALEERNATPRYSHLPLVTNRCALTSRSRGKFPRYRLSRHVWRDLADHGMLSGYIRAKWG